MRKPGDEHPTSARSTFRNTVPSVRGVIVRVLFSLQVHVRSRLKWEALTPCSRRGRVLARANALLFGIGVNGCGKNSTGLLVMENVLGQAIKCM